MSQKTAWSVAALAITACFVLPSCGRQEDIDSPPLLGGLSSNATGTTGATGGTGATGTSGATGATSATGSQYGSGRGDGPGDDDGNDGDGDTDDAGTGGAGTGGGTSIGTIPGGGTIGGGGNNNGGGLTNTEVEDAVNELKDMSEKCGVDFNQTGVESVNAMLRALPIAQKGTVPGVLGLGKDYEATLSGEMQLNASLARIATRTTLAVVEVKPDIVQTKLEDLVAKDHGTVTADLATVAQRAILRKSGSGWNNVSCGVEPVVRTTSALGGGNVVAVFDPPVPGLVSPLLDPALYTDLFPSTRTWTGITATVQASSNDAVKAGQKLIGTVTMTPITPQVTLPVDGAPAVMVTADVAFELTIAFGGPESTMALGLAPHTRYYIDSATKTFKAIVVDGGMLAGSPVAPAIFVAP